jgi:acetyltransferase-like isoleucine patch superfamily enzyme
VFYKIIDKLRYKFLLKWIKPEIIGYKDIKGSTVTNTGISNLTHISNRENVRIEENVFIGHFNYVDGFRKVTIMEGCQITNYVTILTHSTHHALRFIDLSKRNLYSEKVLVDGEVSIGAYTYIGAHTVVMPGSKLGKGCIVSAFSYVNGEFPDYSILRGQPAVVIGSTLDFDNNIISEFPELNSIHYLNKRENK